MLRCLNITMLKYFELSRGLVLIIEVTVLLPSQRLKFPMISGSLMLKPIQCNIRVKRFLVVPKKGAKQGTSYKVPVLSWENNFKLSLYVTVSQYMSLPLSIEDQRIFKVMIWVFKKPWTWCCRLDVKGFLSHVKRLGFRLLISTFDLPFFMLKELFKACS
jgi:hypothetical protein